MYKNMNRNFIILILLFCFIFEIQCTVPLRSSWKPTGEIKVNKASNKVIGYKLDIVKVNKPTPENPILRCKIVKIPLFPAVQQQVEKETVKYNENFGVITLVVGGIALYLVSETYKDDNLSKKEKEEKIKDFFICGLAIGLAFDFNMNTSSKPGGTRLTTINKGLEITGDSEDYNNKYLPVLKILKDANQRDIELTKGGEFEINLIKDSQFILVDTAKLYEIDPFTYQEISVFSQKIRFIIYDLQLGISFDKDIEIDVREYCVQYLKFAQDTVIIRSSPQIINNLVQLNNLIGTGKSGEKYKILSERTGWIEVNYKGKSAWIQNTNGIKVYEPLYQIPLFPPVLSANISFTEPSGNNLLDAEETANIILNLKNTGKGEAYNLNVRVTGAGVPLPELQYQQTKSVNILGPGDSVKIEIPITASRKVNSGEVNFTIEVDEVNGFNLDNPARVRFSTQKFLEPNLILADVGVDDQSKNRIIIPKEIATITCRIHNTGLGKARSVSVKLERGANVFIAGNSPENFILDDIAPNEYKDIKFDIYTNDLATSIPINLKLDEAYGYGKSIPLNLPFNVPQKSSEELIIRGIPQLAKPPSEIPPLTSDADVYTHKPGINKSDAVAVVIGNRNYEKTYSVDFAINDAASIREYLITAFGYKDGRIIYTTDAKLSDFNSNFGKEGNYKSSTLYYLAKEEKSDVFIFYSGHGALDVQSRRGYFVPVDCDPVQIALNGYSLDLFYENISQIMKEKKLPSITIVLDACFSGGFGAVSPIGLGPSININPLVTIPNTSIFTSSSGTEESTWYSDQHHGMLTYFFLKGLQGNADSDKDNNITADELFQFVSDKSEGVPYYAGFFNKKQQTPTFFGDKSRIILKLIK